MKDCEVRPPDQSSDISLMTVDKARPQPFALPFISKKGKNSPKKPTLSQNLAKLLTGRSISTFWRSAASASNNRTGRYHANWRAGRAEWQRMLLGAKARARNGTTSTGGMRRARQLQCPC
jgi:hypothetical protein